MADPNPTDAGGEDRGDTYEPTTVEANRARQQGGGVGQKDLDAQHDPNGASASGRSATEEVETARDAPVEPEIGNGEGGKLGGAM